MIQIRKHRATLPQRSQREKSSIDDTVDRALFRGSRAPEGLDNHIRFGCVCVLFLKRAPVSRLSFRPLVEAHPYPYLDLAVELVSCSQTVSKILDFCIVGLNFEVLGN